MNRILVIEGQGNAPLIQNQLVAPMIRRRSDLSIAPTYIGWRYWPRFAKMGFDIVIGHSLGGPSALEFAKYCPTAKIITIDPRPQSNWGYLDWFHISGFKFVAPRGVVVHNFYEDGFFHGYPVSGATTEQKLSLTTHLTIPGRKEISECLEKLLNN